MCQKYCNNKILKRKSENRGLSLWMKEEPLDDLVEAGVKQKKEEEETIMGCFLKKLY